jgi:hypothetical protein
MDEGTRAATYERLLHVAALLEEEQVEYAVIGGYALALQGIVRLTEDVDILVAPTVENARRWVRALSKLPDGAAKELVGDDTLHTERSGKRSYSSAIGISKGGAKRRALAGMT